MRYRVFLDTNILISGVFFEGNESKILEMAGRLINHQKDIPILAAVLAAKPDFFITGDSHFFTARVKSVVTVKNSKEFLSTIQEV